MFLFQSEGKIPLLSPVDNLPEETKPALRSVFTSNSLQLVLVLHTREIQILDLRNNAVTVSQSLDVNNIFQDVVQFLTISLCNKFLVAGDLESNTAIWENKSNKWVKYSKLPKYHVTPTSLAIQPKTLLLLVVYADQKV